MRWRLLVGCLLLSVCVRCWSQEPLPPAARLVDGSNFNASLAGTDENQFVFSTDDKERTIALDDLLDWGRPAEFRKGTYLLLADGGMLVGEVTSITAEHIQFVSARRPGLWKSNRIPRKDVKSIFYQSSSSAPERDRFDFQLLASTDAQDRLLLADGDSLSGSLLDASSSEDADGAMPVLRFLPPGAKETLKIAQQRVIAVVFAGNGTPPRADANRFWIGLADGSLVLAAGIAPAGDAVTVTLAGGAVLQAAAADSDLEPPESFWSRVTFLQPLSQRVTYLSDVKTIGFKHVPLFDWQQGYANDRSVTRSNLRAGGQRFVKGIGMPATSRLAYEIPEGAKRFEAETAVDDAAGRAGSVTFRVFLEAVGGSWKPAFESKIVRGGDPLQSVRVELGETRRLALVVEMADHGDQRDWADWLNARFVK